MDGQECNVPALYWDSNLLPAEEELLESTRIAWLHNARHRRYFTTCKCSQTHHSGLEDRWMGT